MDKQLWILVGPPGAGKSTWAANKYGNNPKVKIVSRDKIRFSLITDEDEYFSKEKEVLAIYYKEIQDGLEDNEHEIVIADATHISSKIRKKMLNNLTLNDDIAVKIFQFKTSLKNCLKNNAKREGRARVPDKEVRRMFRSVENCFDLEYNYKGCYVVKPKIKEEDTNE